MDLRLLYGIPIPIEKKKSMKKCSCTYHKMPHDLGKNCCTGCNLPPGTEWKPMKKTSEVWWKKRVNTMFPSQHRPLTGDSLEIKFMRKLLADERKRVREIIKKMKLRHITSSKDIQETYDMNEGNVGWDELANEAQKDINAKNQVLDDVLHALEEEK